ncbi:MAG: hypothetical protein K8T91_27530 [Planctomycetes bacterium]|nr:hypothetical protein [Planctomycetota bacterium]
MHQASAALWASFRKVGDAIAPPALAVGVDVTWWGGGRDKNSGRECIAFARKEIDGWGKPQFRRIKLTGLNRKAELSEPNADAHGHDLIAGLADVLREYEYTGNVVVALDAPLMAFQHDLPPRLKAEKSKQQGNVKRRVADREWGTSLSLSPKGWREFAIQPGAPLPPRISAIVENLQKQFHFSLYSPSESLNGRLLIECYPNEVIWSAGVIRNHEMPISRESMCAYKKMGKKNIVLPIDILQKVCDHTLRPCLQLTSVNVDDWLIAFWEWLSNDQTFALDNRFGKTGKCFDDSIDSMLSLIAAVSLVDGQAHVHQGNPPQDGHIIGPGLPTHV